MSQIVSGGALAQYINGIKDNGQLQKQVINVAGVIARQFQKIIGAKDPIHLSDSKDIKKDMEEIAKEVNLRTIVSQLAFNLSLKGRDYLIPTLNSDGTLSVVFQQDGLDHKVVRYNNIPIYSKNWRSITFNRVPYRIREIWDGEKVERQFLGQGNRFIKAESFNAKLPKGLFIKDTEKHNLGILPVVECFNYPTLNFEKTNTQLTDLAFGMGIQELVNNTTFALQREQRNNITRVFLDQGYVDGLDELTQLKAMDSDLFIGLDGTDSKDGALPLEILQGNPKLKEYVDLLGFQVGGMASIIAGIEFKLKNDAGDGTATGTLFAQANTMETLNAKLPQLQEHIRELMVKLYHYKKGIKLDRQELLDFDYHISIVPNIMVNELNLTDTLIKQMQAGLISDVKAKMRLDGIDEETAETELNDVEKKQAEDGVANENDPTKKALVNQVKED